MFSPTEQPSIITYYNKWQDFKYKLFNIPSVCKFCLSLKQRHKQTYRTYNLEVIKNMPVAFPVMILMQPTI
jgi:hypothetical protein